MIVRRVCRAWKERGPIGLIRHVVRRVIPVHISLVYRKSDRSNSCAVQGLLIERYPSRSGVDLEIINTLRMSRGNGMIREMDKLFSRGCELWIGRLEDKIAGICWSCSHKKRTEYFVALDEDDATILSCFVFPQYRGRGIFPAMLQAMVRALMVEDHAHRVYIDCKSWNAPSIRGIQKAGFNFIGSAVRMVLCGRVWILRNQCRKRL